MTNYFDTAAQTWDENKKHIHRTEAIVRDLTPLIANKNYQTALEFGAGTGLLSIALQKHFTEMTLMDSSIEMINTMIEKLAVADIHHLHPLFFDLEKNDYSAKTFDVIYSQMALNHVIDIEKIMSKFYKLLNTNGLLAIADLYEEDGTFHDRAFDGHLGFNPDSLVQILIKQGFKQVEFKQSFEMQKENADKTIKKYPIFLLTAVK